MAEVCPTACRQIAQRVIGYIKSARLLAEMKPLEEVDSRNSIVRLNPQMVFQSATRNGLSSMEPSRKFSV